MASYTAAENNACDALYKRQTAGTRQPADIYDQMSKLSVVDVSVNNLTEGEEIKFPPLEELKKKLYFNYLGENSYTACVAVNGEGKAKVVYFNTLHRSVSMYDPTTKEPLNKRISAGDCSDTSGKEFYDKIMSCPTDKDICDYIAGKTIKVVKLVPVTTARYRDREVIGTRTTNLPLFSVK